MRVPWVDLRANYESLHADLDNAYANVMSEGTFIQGKCVEEFEKRFAEYCGTKHCVGVGNGLEALFLSMLSLGIGKGDEVIVPANTYIATWLAISRTGAIPIPVEPEEPSFNLSPSLARKAVTKKTKAIMMVDLYGRPAEAGELREIADQNDIRLLEDAAQSHGATYHGRRTGSYADIGCFSFYPTKNLGAFGDGGAVTTDNEETARHIRELANYGSGRKNVHVFRGYNSRLDELQASFLNVKLPHLDRWNSRRKAIAKRYTSEFASLGTGPRGMTLPLDDGSIVSSWHIYAIRSKYRDVLLQALSKEGITALVQYPTPPHLQPAYSYMNYQKGSFPVSERIAEEVLCLPIYPEMEEAQVDYVIEKVMSIVASV